MDKEERRKRIKKEKIMDGRAWNYKISSSIAILWGGWEESKDRRRCRKRREIGEINRGEMGEKHRRERKKRERG